MGVSGFLFRSFQRCRFLTRCFVQIRECVILIIYEGFFCKLTYGNKAWASFLARPRKITLYPLIYDFDFLNTFSCFLINLLCLAKRRDISAAYYSLMVVCVELQKLGNRDRGTNATTIPMAPCRRWRGGGGMWDAGLATKVLPLVFCLLIGAVG